MVLDGGRHRQPADGGHRPGNDMPAENAPQTTACAVKRRGHARTKKPDERFRLKIVAPMLSRMANFDDADPLRLEPGVDFPAKATSHT